MRESCGYNENVIFISGLGKVTVNELDPALAFCDILIYGYAGIDVTTNRVKSLNENLDLDNGQGLYRQVTNLKNKYPKLKVLLGVGGGADPNNEIYMQLLENQPAFAIFINSLYTLVKTYRFDGIDLAWQFKTNKPKRVRSGLGTFLAFHLLFNSTPLIPLIFNLQIYRKFLVFDKENVRFGRQTAGRSSRIASQ